MDSTPCRLWILCPAALLALMSLVPPAHTQNTKIERIDIRGNRRCSEDVIRSCIKSRVGGVYDEGRLNLDLRSIYATGDFELVEICERDGDDGKIVTFTVKEKPLIRSIEFVGFEISEYSKISQYFKEHKIDVRVDTLYDPAKIRAAEKALEQMLALQGRHPGKVRIEVEQIPPASVRVKFIRVKD